MSDDINVNEVSDKQAHRTEHIKDKLEDKGLAMQRGREEVLDRPWRRPDTARWSQYGRQIARRHERDHRLGSDKRPIRDNPESTTSSGTACGA